MKYIVYREGKGFMCIGNETPEYDLIINEFTVTFDYEWDAQSECSKGDIVIPINLPLKE